MAPTDPDRPESDDRTLDRLYDLADRLAVEIVERTPDWCQIARDARELARAAEARCSAKP